MLMKLLAASAATATLTASAALVTASPAAPQTGVPRCTNADLDASFVPTGAAAGSTFGRVRLTNVSDHRCVTGGFGGVSYVGDGDGTQIGHPAVRQHRERAKSFVLAPGQRLISDLQMANARNYPRSRCRPAHVDGFRVYVPNATLSQYVVHPTLGCRNPAVHLLHHVPYHR